MKDRIMLPLMRQLDGEVLISGGGDPFASKHYRSILADLNPQDFPGLKLILLTNGLLLTPQRWSEFPTLGKMIGRLSVSVDAARAATYEKVRRPGKWAVISKNLEFIAGLRIAGHIPYFSINFVVQNDNYLEMLEFLDLGERLQVDKVCFQRVVNFGSYDEARFAQVDVASPHHPAHPCLLEILRHPRMSHPRVFKPSLNFLLPELVSEEAACVAEGNFPL
jgi:MoaA/NifB/PqqE/SkfB family radical SAM enzyme